MQEKKENLLTISEFAEIAEISRKGLIFYDNTGVFSPEYTAPNGYRYYSHEQIYLISAIGLLKELGTPLQQIKAYMQDSTPESAVALLEQQGKKISQKIKQLQETQDMLQTKLKRLNSSFGFFLNFGCSHIKSRYENICFLYDYLLLIFGYLWYNINT
ncbi:MAG: MerR family transcriptional regulator [Faecalimonas sp.]|nr:MerR family transcriptional regulator [Faecalimonas sp.]